MSVRKIISVISVCAFVGSLGLSGAAVANASAGGEATFAAQIREVGLTKAQSVTLQSRVNRYLKTLGGRQVAINKIDLGGKGFVLLALPGERRARDLDSPVQTTSGPNFCYYHYFCAYSARDFYGDAVNASTCGDYYTGQWRSVGSWANNQTRGVRAKIEVNGSWRHTPAAYSQDTSFDWAHAGWIVPC